MTQTISKQALKESPLRSPERDDLMEAARVLGPLIREHSQDAERRRRPSPRVMEALAQTGFQRMFVPRSLGGLEVDPLTYVEVAEIVAGFDSVAGWALQLGNQAAWWASRLPEEGVEEIYAEGPDAMVAVAFHPPMPAEEVDGGYRVSGRAPLASNIHDAQWLLISGLVTDGEQPRVVDGAPEVIQALVPADQVSVLDTWYALGMRGTDSQDVVLDNVVVPRHRTFPLTPELEPGDHYQGPLYRFPGIGELVVIFAPVFLAIGRGAITSFRELAMGKTRMGSNTRLQERTSAQAVLARAEGLLRSARSLLYATVRTAWRRTANEERVSLDEKADLLLAGAQTGSAVSAGVELLHAAAGTSAIYHGHALERHFRDAQTLRHHGLVSAERYETVGQVYMGVSPEFPMVHF